MQLNVKEMTKESLKKLKFLNCQLQMTLPKSICQGQSNKGICHLPLQRLNAVLLQLQTFNIP